MTKDELFDAFFEDASLRYPRCGEPWRQVKSAWNGLVAPYLAIPRSLKDDPPKEAGTYYFLSNHPHDFDCRTFHDWPEGLQHFLKEDHIVKRMTHWIKLPCSMPDKDEQDFEEWQETIRQNWVGKGQRWESLAEAQKEAWMAARGRK